MSETSKRQPTAKEILAARARELARPVGGDVAAAGTEALEFSLGREKFAIASRYVFAVFPLAELVPLPGATPPVVGLTRWRGDVLTILDLRRLVGSVTTALDDLSRVIVVGDTFPEFGVLADVVNEIGRIDLDALHALPSERRVETRMLRGVTRDAIHVIDAAALIARQADAHSLVEPAVSPSSSSDS